MAKIIVESEESKRNLVCALTNAANIIMDCGNADRFERIAIPDILCLLCEMIEVKETVQ